MEVSQLISGVAYIEMRTRFFDECLDIYSTQLGLTGIQDTTAVLNDKGEWESTASSESGNREAVLQVGDSFLIIHEDQTAPAQINPDGKDYFDSVIRPTPGSVGHWSFFVEGNHHTLSHLKNFSENYRFFWTKEPSVQPMNHSYLQRSLLEFSDPNGYTIQISEIVDPRPEKQDRRREKQAIANLSTGGLIKGFDHINMTCPDINDGIEMYGRKLGLPYIPDGESRVFQAGLCDIELSDISDLQKEEPERTSGKGTVGSFGLWSDDVDSLAKKTGHPTSPEERDIALGVRVKSIVLDVGGGFPVEISQPI